MPLLGGVNALQDALILANCIYDLENSSETSLAAAFQSYYDQRYERTRAVYKSSLLISKVTVGLVITTAFGI
jgi:2-polyprenyl-6-methoxyphenol hydroxylase-like FAD-dependent oxidoreductase